MKIAPGDSIYHQKHNEFSKPNMFPAEFTSVKDTERQSLQGRRPTRTSRRRLTDHLRLRTGLRARNNSCLSVVCP